MIVITLHYTNFLSCKFLNNVFNIILIIRIIFFPKYFLGAQKIYTDFVS